MKPVRDDSNPLAKDLFGRIEIAFIQIRTNRLEPPRLKRLGMLDKKVFTVSFLRSGKTANTLS
jgi:hypothetical protein